MLFIVFGTFFHTAETFVNKAESSLGLYPTRRSLQFSLVAQLCLTLPTPQSAARQASLSITNSQSLLKLMFIKSMMPSNYLILCHPLLLPPSIFPSTRLFSNESALHVRWPKYWSFRFSISPSNEYSGLISIRMDWLDLLAVQESLKSLLQHHSSKAQFFGAQLALWSNSHIHTCMTTGKTIALTRQTFAGKVKEQAFFNFMAAVTICSDFRAPK